MGAQDSKIWKMAVQSRNGGNMWAESKDDGVVMEAIKAQNNGQLTRAAALYQRAGNQYRNPEEKEQLWKAAKHARYLESQD